MNYSLFNCRFKFTVNLIPACNVQWMDALIFLVEVTLTIFKFDLQANGREI
jgi:hypothetical protein